MLYRELNHPPERERDTASPRHRSPEGKVSQRERGKGKFRVREGGEGVARSALRRRGSRVEV